MDGSHGWNVCYTKFSLITVRVQETCLTDGTIADNHNIFHNIIRLGHNFKCATLQTLNNQINSNAEKNEVQFNSMPKTHALCMTFSIGLKRATSL